MDYPVPMMVCLYGSQSMKRRGEQDRTMIIQISLEIPRVEFPIMSSPAYEPCESRIDLVIFDGIYERLMSGSFDRVQIFLSDQQSSNSTLNALYIPGMNQTRSSNDPETCDLPVFIELSRPVQLLFTEFQPRV